jgi:hypothetical protein
MARGEGPSRGPLLLLLLLLGAGGWNYYRNWEAESRIPRPYRGLSASEVEALAASHRREAEALEARYAAARRSRAPGGSAQLLGDRVDEYEAAAAQGRRTRELGADLSEHEAVLDELALELERRVAERDWLRLHLRRLVTL